MEEQKKRTAREIIENYDGPAVRIMEVCGTHTHEIFRLGIRKLLPKQVELISGPGCPVCVTPVSFIDEAIYLALEKQVTICTFGDLVRVPGSQMSLAGAREKGAKIHIVYSPADAEKYAKDHPEEQVTFLSVGFETTTPAGCLSVKMEFPIILFWLPIRRCREPTRHSKAVRMYFYIRDTSMQSRGPNFVRNW